MGKVLITEQHLQDIADAIRSKSGDEDTYTPGEMAGAIMEIETGITPTGTKQIAANGTHDVTQYASASVQVPNTYEAADEGKVVSSGALVAQTSKTVTANGTYDTTENDEVVVNVSGGGGGGTKPSFLTHSTPGDVLANSYYSDFTAGANAWGNLTVTGSPTIDAAGIHTARGNGFSYDLGEANHDVTIYAIVRGYASGDLFALGTSYALSSGNTISIFTRNSTWYSAAWGNDTNTNVNYNTAFAVLTIAIDAQAKRAYYYINGSISAAPYKTFNNSAQIVRFNGSNSHSDRAGAFDYLYAGVVDGCEDSTTILANQLDMINYLSSGRIGGGTCVGFIRAAFTQGKIITCTDGTTTLSSDSSGHYVFEIPYIGIWTLTDGDMLITVNVSYGFGYDATFSYLPESNDANIKAQAFVKNFQADSSNWGGLTKNDVTKYIYTQGNDFVAIASDSLYYAPSSDEESFTAYYVCRCTDGSLARLLAIYTSEANPGKPCWFKENSIYKAYDNGNVNTPLSSSDRTVLAISRDAGTGTVKWYINGTLFRTTTGYTKQPNYIYYNGTGNNYRANANAYFMGLVLGAENDETVLGNMQYLMNIFDI